MKKNFLHTFLTISFAVLCSAFAWDNAFAQAAGSSKGKDFWLTFMPNVHRGVGAIPGSPEDALRRTDSLYIFIAAEKVTTGKITYKDKFNRPYVRNFTITNPSQIYSFSVMWDGFELVGVNTGSVLQSNGGQAEKVAPQSFRVETDNDVMVYALSQAWTTSDAFLVLPAPALERDYFVMSYYSDNLVDDRTGRLSIGSMPSQCAIVATEDNTRITIKPTTPLLMSGMNPSPIVLNKGDVYLLQSLLSTTLNYDLTGTSISSDKPIAVFGGHQRARIPMEEGDRLTSRDCLIEQMVPTANFGKSAFLTPYPLPGDASPVGWDVFRVLAALDSTVIYVDSTPVAQLNAGEFFTGNLSRAAEVYSDKPFMVAQYKKTSTTENMNLANSDPFMMMIPPFEQFLPSYRFISAQAVQLNSEGDRTKVYNYQYVNVVAPELALDSVVLDGVRISKNSFSRIGKTKFFYATLSISDGVHNIGAGYPIGIYVYGYGPANSYGYIGGMSFTLFDYRAPVFGSVQDCKTVKGFVYDSTSSDSHIKNVISIADSQVNTNIAIQSFTPYPDSVGYSAALIDDYQDGFFTIAAEDSAGYRSRKQYAIPGFTLKVKTDSSIAVITKNGPLKKEFCFPILIENYGKFPQTISSLLLERYGGNIITSISTNESWPITIPPGANKEITLCVKGDTIGFEQWLMSIKNDCFKRTIVDLTITANPDITPPIITENKSDCGLPAIYDISDETIIDSGLDSVAILDGNTLNCKADITRKGDRASVTVSIINQYEDAYYTLLISDKAGNRKIISDTIPGLTLAIEKTDGSSLSSLSFDTTNLGNTICDTIVIKNSGRFTIKLPSLFIHGNRAFSIPPSQYPLAIASGEKHSVAVCYHPLEDANVLDTIDHDTLSIYYSCAERAIDLFGRGKEIKSAHSSKCELSITTSIVELPGLIAGPYPHPVANNANIDLAIVKPGAISIYAYTFPYANNRETVLESTCESGQYSIRFSTEHLKTGYWMLEINTADGKLLVPMLVE